MEWQNLTPQLRTRLSRLERWVGVFVALAIILLLTALGFYLYQTAQRKGWLLVRAPYFTYVDNAAGLKVGDKIKLMGFDVGEIVEITAMPPFDPWNVFVAFVVREPYYGYLWSDSRARVAPADLLGNRSIEVTKGSNGYPTYLFHDLRELSLDEALSLPATNRWAFNEELLDDAGRNRLIKIYDRLTYDRLKLLANRGSNIVHAFDTRRTFNRITAIYDDTVGHYTPVHRDLKGYFLPPDESPALTERLEQVVNLVENTLPNILDLTNHLQQVLSNASHLAVSADRLLHDFQPAATNLSLITAQLREPHGALGQWLLPTNLQQRLDQTLDQARLSLQSAQTLTDSSQLHVQTLATNLLASLIHVANLTSNLNAQAQANQFLLGDLADLIRNTDDMVQGLKRHWLLKAPFQPAPPTPPRTLLPPSLESPP